MKPGGPWSVKGIEPQAREAAKTAARRAGKTLGEWLNQVIMDSGQEELLTPTDLLRNPELWQSEEGEAPWSQAIEEITRRIDTSEKRNVDLLRQIDSAIGGLASQLAAKKDTPAGPAVTDDFAERILALEAQAQRMLSRDSLRIIEKAVGDVAVVLGASEKRHSERSDRIERNLEELSGRIGSIESQVSDFSETFTADQSGIGDPAFAASLAAEMAALRDRVQESEEHATNAFENVHRNISEVVQRLDKKEDVAALITASEARAKTSVQEIEQALAQVSQQIANAATHQAQEFDELRATLGAIDERVQTLESAPPRFVDDMKLAEAHKEAPVSEVHEEIDLPRHDTEEAGEMAAGPMFGLSDSLTVETPATSASHIAEAESVTGLAATSDSEPGEEESLPSEADSEWEIVDDEPRRSPVEVLTGVLSRIKSWRRATTEDEAQTTEDEAQENNINDEPEGESEPDAAVRSFSEPVVSGEETQETPTSNADDAPVDEPKESEDDIPSLSTGFVIGQSKENGEEGAGDLADDEPTLSAKLKNIRDALISQSPEEEESFRGSLRELVSRDEEENNKRPYYLASGALVLAVATIMSIVLLSDNGVQLEADGNRPSFGENVRGLIFGAPGVLEQTNTANDGTTLEDELAGRLDDNQIGTLTELSETIGALPENTTGLPGAVHSADFDVTAGLLTQAENGDVKAQFALARAYATGQGFTQDQQLALRWYRAAAGQELAVAQYLLGSHYERGLGVARDGAAAVDWYARAAAGGNARAMHNLAVAYAQGNQVEQDLQLAVHWFQEAAELGLTDAQFNLGLMLERGLGVAADKVQAFKWYSVAALNGDEGAGRRVEQISDEISESDFRFVELFVETWRPRAQDPIANGLFDISPMAFSDQARRTEIAHVQDMLDRLGYNIAATDGIFDPTTTAAIKEYQNLSLMPASGEITPELVERLEEAIP